MNELFAVDCRMLGLSGIGTFTANLLDSLIATSDESWLLLGRPTDLAPWADNPRVTVEPTDIPLFSLRELTRFPTRAVNRCDAFFTPNFNIPGGIRVPVFSTIHDVVFLDVPGLAGPLGTAVRREFLNRAMRLSHTVFTVSEFSRDRIRHHLGNSTPVEVVHNTIPPHIRHLPSDARDPWPGGSYILFVGNLKAHKGLDTLLAAWRMARGRGFPHRLVIVGEAEGFRTPGGKITGGGDPDVVFTGRIDNDRLARTIAGAEALVQPSRYEGFGIPPLEALWLGVPAIVSDIPVFREIYGSLPVTFFKVGDEADLAGKLLNHSPKRRDSRSAIDRLFNPVKSAAAVLDHIRNRRVRHERQARH